jgi:ABC-type sugar transport system substrate-binding protein
MRCALRVGVLLLLLPLAGCGSREPAGPKKLKVGLMPKLIGISYFTACERGAREAAEELGVELIYDGPPVDQVEEQAKIIDRWIAQGLDVIAVAPNDPEVIAPALRRAKEAGIAVLTWDADANPETSGRATFVNQAPVEEIGTTMVDVLAEGVGGKGTVAIVTGSATSPNQNAWMEVMRRRMAEKYPELKLLEPLVSDEDQARAQQLTRDLINAQPELVGVWGITSVALPGAAKAVRDAGRTGEVYVTGLSLPSSMREYVKDGTVPKFVLWNPVDLGYLTVQVGKRLAEGTLQPGKQAMGRLGEIEVREGEVVLGPPLVFDAENIDQYDF